MTDFNTIETLARRLAAERGCDYDAKGAKRGHWRRKALAVSVLQAASLDKPKRGWWRRWFP